MKDANWRNNHLQFPRLIAELVASVDLTEAQLTELRTSMDVTAPELDELFERAQLEWERLKAGTAKARPSTPRRELHEYRWGSDLSCGVLQRTESNGLAATLEYQGDGLKGEYDMGVAGDYPCLSLHAWKWEAKTLGTGVWVEAMTKTVVTQIPVSIQHVDQIRLLHLYWHLMRHECAHFVTVWAAGVEYIKRLTVAELRDRKRALRPDLSAFLTTVANTDRK